MPRGAPRCLEGGRQVQAQAVGAQNLENGSSRCREGESRRCARLPTEGRGGAGSGDREVQHSVQPLSRLGREVGVGNAWN